MARVVNKTDFRVIESVHTPGTDYENGDWLINPDIPSIYDNEGNFVDYEPKRYWKVSGDNIVLKSAAKRSEADAQHLLESKEYKKIVLKEELADALGSKYGDDEKLSLLLILQLAVASGNTARVNYLTQLAAWIDQGQDLLYVQQDNVDAATNIEEVDSIELDLDSWLAADPQVVIRTAKGIE